ncbi:hypothetical protein SAY86_029715 [Trapa natans]|uniref:Myb-like domain-containing protein n=1 Tax=Trapa natans TaxID=22666 RepID=A0AAN7R9Y0_TRANT|nr:hypothetical protein SAY86_029715 [Trapa natans]
MQQGGGSQSHQYPTGGGDGAQQHQQSSEMEVEEASPISSRPPVSSENLDDFMSARGGGSGGGGFSEMDALAIEAAGDEVDRGGGGSGTGGNRWPRHETLALLSIRMEMDAAFREASVKGPLWDDVSRKLAELGYKRSAKKCKEKFENVDKYYKRTKEGRASRQDGKSYKFFSELEALHNISTSHPAPQLPPSVASVAAPPIPNVISFPAGVGYSSPMPISSIRPLHGLTASISPVPLPPHQSHLFQPATTVAAGAPLTFTASPMGLDFSSDTLSSSQGTEDDDEEENGGSDDMEGEPFDAAAGGSSRKRKRSRGGGGSGSRRRMMELFERLMKQVMKKQEAMQHEFLEAIEKREHERMMREEAWRRQEMARLAREHEIIAQERAVSASRDAKIMAFLQKITGQTIHLPPAPPTPPIVTITTTSFPVATPPQQLTPQSVPQPVLHVPPPQYQQQKPQQRQVDMVLAAVPEQQVRPQLEDAGGSGGRGSGPPSSRWPKTEVLALIKLRSGLETRYQEAGPKGPLWEEISAGMQRMGYKRSAKRCKEKWENINKYFKKVKESSKKRPEDSKTCPYYHELDALYQKKIFPGSSSIEAEVTASGNAQQAAVHHGAIDNAPLSVGLQELQPGLLTVELQATKDEDNTIEEGNDRPKKPEDTVKELMIGRGGHPYRPDMQQKRHVESSNGESLRDAFQLQHCPVDDDDEECEENDIMEGDEYDDDPEDEEEESQGGMKTATATYRIEYQQKSSSRQSAAGPPNSGGGGAAPATTSFMAMVQ